MLLKDAISIPTSVRQGDLVFKLSDANEHTKATVDQYVVTPQLETAFLKAVALVKAAVDERKSKAAFLSGSFGSGKSNFMGLLQLLLDGNSHALAKSEFAAVVAQLADWRQDRRFLTVPYHLIGATSFDSAVLGGYVDHVRALHPDAPLPDVYADEPILANGDQLRSQMGDGAFFSGLGGGEHKWGDLARGWDAERYDTARTRSADDPERRLLVQTLLDTYLSSFAEGARANREGYVDIETGLEAISRHAKELGYSGLILFLDELILWLMSRMADPAFVSAESSKISKLVEGSDDRRPVPIISIIARQRDLRELIGTDVPGLDRMGFIDNLKFQSGRFSDIKLDDSNLPLVAHERLLKPVDAKGTEALATAFAAVSVSLTEEQRDALRGPSGTDDDFRLTYPFSPSFLTVVVDVAGALQRTRTGLRVLLELLVTHRDTLEVGQLVPVGDLFDVLAAADEPLSEGMKDTFDAARRLYGTELRPMLLADHQLAPDVPVTDAFRTDDRLVKTLLLAALVPNSEPFQNLTARKLLALNHGLITSPVPGAEIQVVINKLNTWATRPIGLQVGGDPQNPTAHVVLSELNLAAILEGVAGVDNPGARRKLLKEMVSESLGLPIDQLMQSTTVTWRGLPRTVDLVFGNVRDTEELADSVFASSGSNWKVVVDFPFDDDGIDPRADVARAEALRAAGNEWRTVCWIPSFFTAEVRSQVGDLVRLNHLIPVPGQMSDRLREATQHLSPESRESARPQLEAMQKATRERLRQALKQAYGVTSADPSVVDSSIGLADHFPALVNGLSIQPPVAPDLRGAFESVVGQALAHVYPAAPEIDGDVRRGDVATVLRICEEAVEQPGLRLAQVPTGDRKVMSRIANPLRLGVQSEQAFTLDGTAGHWDTHFTREIAKWRDAGGDGDPTVGDLRRWIDQPRGLGLSTELQNLILMVWANATDRAFRDHGGPASVALDRLPDHLQVIDVALPTDAEWAEARSRAEHVLGVAGLPDDPSAVGLSRLSNELARAVTDHAADTERAATELESLDALLPTGGEPNRLRTARVAASLLRALASAESDIERVRALVDADLTPSAPAVGSSVKAARAVIAAVETLDLEIVAAAMQHPDGEAVTAGLVDMMSAEELATKFAPTLTELYGKARDLIVAPPPPPPPPPADSTVLVDQSGLDRDTAIAHLDAVRTRLLTDTVGEEFDVRVTARPATRHPEEPSG